MADKQYKWGIIGPGKIAQKFADAISRSQNSQLYAVASRDLQRATSFIESFKGQKAYGSYLKLIEDPEVDIIYIATPHSFHYDIAKTCLGHHKAVLVEKPLTLDAAQTEELIQLSKSNNTFLMEALWTRFIPMTTSILKTIKSGAIGEITYIKADFGFNAPYNPQGRLFDPKLGGGSLLDVGIYPLFLSTLLLGSPEQILATGRLSEANIDLDCQATLRFPNNKTAVIGSSIHYHMPITAEIIGTQGEIKIPCPWYKNHYYYMRQLNKDCEKVELLPLVNGFEYEINEAINCLAKSQSESARWSHQASLDLAKIMDEIKRQIGVQYPSKL